MKAVSTYDGQYKNLFHLYWELNNFRILGVIFERGGFKRARTKELISAGALSTNYLT